jgi:L-threonylcarbamoyladenylate synthase
VVLVSNESDLMQVLKRETRQNRVGVLLPFEWRMPLVAATVLRWGSWSEPEALARDLYAQLRALDDEGMEVIVCPLPPAEGIGMAIRDRLRKASQ